MCIGGGGGWGLGFSLTFMQPWVLGSSANSSGCDSSLAVACSSSWLLLHRGSCAYVSSLKTQGDRTQSLRKLSKHAPGRLFFFF